MFRPLRIPIRCAQGVFWTKELVINQILGLTDALGRIVPTDCHDIEELDSRTEIKNLLFGRVGSIGDHPSPDLLVKAGHAPHVPILSARRKLGGKAILLMKPSLPLFLFDLCLIPAADR